MPEIPFELRYPCVVGWAKKSHTTVAFKNIPPGTTEIEVKPDPDYMKVLVQHQYSAPTPAGATEDIEVKYIHSYGIGIEDYTECDILLTHSTIDYSNPCYVSAFPDYPIIIKIVNNTGEPQTFYANYVWIIFTNKKDFEDWRKWLKSLAILPELYASVRLR